MDTATEFTFVDQANNIPLTQDQLKLKLKHQLEFYFSMENLSNDTYMLSQMDHDHYIPISTIANFNKVKHLTTDLTLVVEVLKESPYVQVEQTGLKVRPVQKQRSILILREIPQATPIEDVEKLFRGENCPTLVSCEFGLNNSWYVFFESEQDAQQAYKYLREERATFQGKPIMARIKAKQVLQSASQLPPSASLQATPPNASNTPQPSPQQASPHLAKNLQVRVVPAVVKPTVPSDLPLSQPSFSNFSYITHLQPTAFIHNSANFPLWQQINSPLISLDPSMFRFTPLYDLNKKSHTDHALHNQSLQQQQLQQQPTTEQPQQHGQLIQQEQQQKQFHNFFQNQHKPQFHQPFYSSYPQQQHHHQQQPQQQKHQHPQQKHLQQQQHKNRQQQQQQQQRFNNKKTTIQDNNNNDIVNNTLNNTTNDKRSDELKVFKPLSPFQNSFQQQQHQQQQQLQQHQQQHLITFPQRLQLSNMQQHPQIFTLESPRTLTKTSADRKEYAQRHRKTDSHKHLLDNSSKQQINFSPSYTFPPPPHIASGFYNSPLKSAQFHFDNTSSAFNNNSNSYKNNNNPTNLNNINKNVNNIYINNINNANNINNNVYNKNNVNTLSKQAYFRDASFSSYSKNQSFNNNNNNNSSSNNNNNKLTSESYSSALPVSSSTPPSSSSSSSSSSFPPSSSSLPKSVISSSTSSTSSTSTTTPSTSTTKTTTSSSSSSSSACTASQALFAPMPKQLQETACNSKSHQNNNINSPTFVSSNKIDISKNNTFQHKKNNDPNNDHNNPIPKKNISANNITSSHPHTRPSISCTPSTHPTNRTDHRPRSVQHKTFEAQQQDPDCSTKNNKNKNNKNIVNNNDNVKNTVTENGNDVNSVTNKSNNSNKIIRNTLNEHYKCNKKVNNNNKNNYNNKNVINNNKNNDDSNNNDTMKQPPKHNCESSAKAFHSAASPQPPHLSSSLSSSLLQPPPSSSAPPSSKDPVAKTRPSFKPSPDNSNQHSNKKSSVRPRKGSSYSRNGRQSNRAKLVREDSKQKKSVGRDKGAPVHEPFDKSFPPLFLNKNCPYHHESETKESHSASATLKNIAVKPLMDCNSRLSYAQIAQRSASVQIASDEDCTPPLQSMPIQSVAPPLVTAPLA